FPTISDQVTILWHAGEPLVLGVDYYEAAFSCIGKVCPAGLSIDHSIQTNGILINDKWCDFFQKWNVSLGVSIDGPQEVNDAARRTRAGKGTYDKVITGINCLQRRNIPFYVLSVLTKSALLAPDALFWFYHDFNIRDVGFNIDELEGVNEVSSLSH